MNRQRGMTMVELMVSLAVVMVILCSATAAYLKLLRTYKTQGRLAESYMANLTGMEMLRYDIEMAGFGLPTILGAVTYTEASDASVTYYNPATLNDSPSTPPRAIVHLNNTGANNSDVLAIKSTAANITAASRKWSMVTNAGGTPTVKLWGVTALDPVMDFTTGDRFIALSNNGTLQVNAGSWCYTFNASAPNTGYYSSTAPGATAIGSPNAQQVYYMYGLDNSIGAHTMPFNRVDYYLDKIAADFPTSSCAASTYTLYRSTINQATGALVKAPLVDCVRDFQVAFGLDNSAGALPLVWQQTPPTAAQVQQQLREVRVFVLYQEGLGDTGKSPGFRFSGTLNLGDQDIANSLDPGNYPANTFQQWSAAALPGTPQLSHFTPAGPDLQYRWKILEMSVKPMNLLNLITR
jgi:type IV pilus assembly protein PilW